MKIDFNEITIKNIKVAENLKTYLFKISNYQNFDPQMKLRIFVDKDKDFTAFESVDYNLQFTSSAHKISETIFSPYPQIETTFYNLNKLVNSIC